MLPLCFAFIPKNCDCRVWEKFLQFNNVSIGIFYVLGGRFLTAKKLCFPNRILNTYIK